MLYEEKRDLILNGNIYKAILILAGPIMLNNLIQSIYNLTDTYFVSQLGSTQMAAMTLVWPVIFFFLAIGMGISVAGTSLISQHIGNNNKKRARKTAGEVITVAFLVSLILGLTGTLLAPTIVKLMGGKGELLSSAVIFLRIILLGMPTLFLFLAFTAIKQGQGDTVTPMKYTAVSVGLNIILDPILIFSFKLGIAGAAIATVLARGIFTIYAIYRLFTRENGLKLKLQDLIIDKYVMKLIKVGLPSSIGQATAAFGFMFLNIFIISFGQSTLAAFGIGNRINSLILLPAMGIGKTLATIVGQNLGADQIERAREAVKKSVLLTTSVLIAGGVIIYPFIPVIISQFTEEKEVAVQAIRFLRFITITLSFMGFFQIFIGTFQGSGHTVYAMILMIGRLWVIRLPLILLLKKYTDLGSDSVWYAMVISNGLISLAGFLIYLSGKWQKKVIKKHPRPV